MTRHMRGRDQGFSLVEVMVAMLVMSLLGLAVVATVSSVARASNETTNRLSATTRAQTISDRLSKSLRAAHLMSTVPASAFTLADPRHVTFYSDAGDAFGPRLLDVVVPSASAATTMTQVTKVPTAANTYPTTGTSQTLAPGDLDASGASVFQYYDGNGAAMTGSLTATQMSNIAQVRLTLTLDEPGLGAGSTVSTLVYLRNVEYR